MKLLRNALLLGALALPQAIVAQGQRPSSEAATAEQRLAEDLGLERLSRTTAPVLVTDNISTLQQIGNGSTARLDQQSLAAPANQALMVQVGNANVLGLTQTGAGNRLNAVQIGSGNTADFVQDGISNTSTLAQKGSQNAIKGLVDGDRNQLNVVQTGNGNEVDSELRQNGRRYNITQLGQDNTLTQKETSAQSPQGYNVLMVGRGINITIEQGRVIR